MPKTRTYYDELNVARDASAEEIKLAFRKLAQQLHPDRNPAANASDLMALLNAAHDVLADPGKRAEYDATLIRQAQQARGAAAQRRQAQAGRAPVAPVVAVRPKPSRPAAQAKTSRPLRRGSRLRWAALFILFCAGGAWMGYDPDAGKPFVPPPVIEAVATVAPVESRPEAIAVPIGTPIKLVDPAQPQCIAPPVDPLGAPWPTAAGYISGLPVIRDGGWSEITVDNSAGNEPVYAKVTDAGGRHAYRHAFIPAHSSFTFARMDVGYYLLKYKMLDTGCAYASSRIRLEETAVNNRVKSTVYKLTLRKLENRNSQFSNVRSDEF
ncbi:DnaJ domain-containing protein [Pseudomonas sp. G.S.17]|uniref:J domain-containing protein n=1 Tax=Pseudomonas sp. G.S.17 TaxID=3137451 RepID=UPI00311CBC2F